MRKFQIYVDLRLGLLETAARPVHVDMSAGSNLNLS